LYIGYHFYGPPAGIAFNSSAASLRLTFKLGAYNKTDQELLDALNITFFPGTTNVQQITLTFGTYLLSHALPTNHSYTGTTTFKGTFLEIAQLVANASLINLSVQWEGGLVFSFVLPYFQQLAIIDPDFSVVFGQSGSSSGDGSSSFDTSNSDNLPLILGLSVGLGVGVPLVMLLVVGVLVLVAFVSRVMYYRVYGPRGSLDALNY